MHWKCQNICNRSIEFVSFQIMLIWIVPRTEPIFRLSFVSLNLSQLATMMVWWFRIVFSILHILLKDENTFKLDSCSPFFLIYILVSHQKIDFSVQWTSRYLYFFEKLIFFSYKLAGQINIACIYAKSIQAIC